MSGGGWAAIVSAYLLGSIPFGLIIHKLMGRGDIRAHGSGNIGATNVLRTGGRAAGIATLVLDAGKGAAATLLARALSGEPSVEAAAAFVSVLGHCHPIWLGFRGGKGVATACGAYYPLAPVPMTLSLALFGALSLTTRIVSLGSLAAGVALPLLILWWNPARALLLSVLAALALVVLRHRENISRLIEGRERRIGAEKERDA